MTPGAFPATQGRTLQELSNTITSTGPQLAFASFVLTTGKRERLAFGLIDQGKNFLYAPTALYLAPSGGKAKALGPFVAPADLLVTDTPFRSKTAATEESSFAAVYEAMVPLDRPGMYDVLAVAKVAGKDVAAGSQVKVVRPAQDEIPDVGERPPSVETDTLASAACAPPATATPRSANRPASPTPRSTGRSPRDAHSCASEKRSSNATPRSTSTSADAPPGALAAEVPVSTEFEQRQQRINRRRHRAEVELAVEIDR